MSGDEKNPLKRLAIGTAQTIDVMHIFIWVLSLEDLRDRFARLAM